MQWPDTCVFSTNEERRAPARTHAFIMFCVKEAESTGKTILKYQCLIYGLIHINNTKTSNLKYLQI